MKKLARGSVIEVDERGLVRFDPARERFDREQMAGLGRGLSDEDKDKLRRAARPLVDTAGSLVDAINGLGRWLVAIPTPVLIGGLVWWLGPSVVSGATAGAVARRREGRARRGR